MRKTRQTLPRRRRRDIGSKCPVHSKNHTITLGKYSNSTIINDFGNKIRTKTIIRTKLRPTDEPPRKATTTIPMAATYLDMIERTVMYAIVKRCTRCYKTSTNNRNECGNTDQSSKNSRSTHIYRQFN
jgi:hypothetical protein